MKFPKQKRRWALGLGLPAIALTLLWGGFKTRPYLKLFTEEIPVTALADFAQGGALSGELAAYNRVPRIDTLRPYLSAPLSADPAAIPPLVASPEGQIVLERLGRLILTRDRHNGRDALAQGLAAAAAQDDLSLIAVLENVPEGTFRLSASELWRTAWRIGRDWQQNRGAIARLDRAFRQAQSAQVPRFRSVPALVQPGEATVWFTWLLEDRDRDRKILVDFYLSPEAPQEPAPVVIISHGLTANRRTFVYLARHLASHGFSVVTVEHLDSNGDAYRQFLAGKKPTLLSPDALLERPRDISFVLDTLAKSDLGQSFDLKRVGLVGHSLGGNTALALAGAKFDRTQLAEACPQRSQSLNLSLIFAQCPALNLPAQQTQQTLRDPRITSIVTINPVASQVFSAASLAQLEVPLLMVASEQDWITPAREEQILPFQQLLAQGQKSGQKSGQKPGPKPQQYLALLRGAQHWTAMGGADCLVPGPALSVALSGERQKSIQQRQTRAIARDYLCSLSTAFFETTLRDKPLQAYLSADYAAAISQPQLPLVFVASLPQTRTMGLLRAVRRRPERD